MGHHAMTHIFLSSRMNQESMLTASDSKTGIELADLFEAYEDCRANKRGTINALAFELDYEQELLQLPTLYWR